MPCRASAIAPSSISVAKIWIVGADEIPAAYSTSNIASEPLPWLDGQVDVTVSDASGTCNAMSNGDDLFFFDSSDNCENTARIPDVVYHEAGHSVHNQALIPGVGLFEGALSEGVSDYLSATITGDSGVARGFFYDSQPLRERVRSSAPA